MFFCLGLSRKSLSVTRRSAEVTSICTVPDKEGFPWYFGRMSGCADELQDLPHHELKLLLQLRRQGWRSGVHDLKSQLESVRDEATELLNFHEIYDILSYGWEDADTPDPEYFGHAMWQMSPPFTPDWSVLFGGTSATYEPTKRDEILVLNGEDFAGTMIFARRSLGMALLYSTVAENDDGIGENVEFWHEYATTMQWLNIASDRIRDYFVMARFGKKTAEAFFKAYKERNPDSSTSFATPFEEALNGAPDDSLDVLRRLHDIAVALQSHRTDRNAIVHKVATRTAQQSLWILRDQRQRAASRQSSRQNASPQDVSTPPAEATVPAIQQLKRWYLELVQMSSFVFEFFNRKNSG